MTLLLNRAEIEQVLDISSVIGAVERGFADFSGGKTIMPVRTAVRVQDPPGVMLVMPCAMTESGALGTKIVSVFRQHRVAPAKLNISIRVGARVPANVHFYPVPQEVIVIYPEWRGHMYFIVNDEIIIVDSRHRIIAVLPV